MFIEQQFGIDYECIERLFPKPQALPQNGSQLDAEFAGDHPFPVEPSKESKKSKNGTPALDKYGKDMTEQARNGELDPVVGRQIEIERVIQILSRRKKNNPILIGEPGVGKSAIVEGLALRIENGEAETLKGRRIVALDIASMVAGTTYRGQFEERIKTVINELHKHPEIILFVDEIHTIMGAGNAQGSLDAANILKPALARGEVQCIGATTTAEYRKTIEKDGALERRFQKVQVQPTSIEETYTVLTRISEVYGTFHKVQYTEEALHACVQLTDRYISDRCFPDKAIDAMDEAGAYKRQTTQDADSTPIISESDIALVVSRMSGVPYNVWHKPRHNNYVKWAPHLNHVS
jgi:ATP-dependent Clp protease ATP-binding subunit ClpC